MSMLDEIECPFCSHLDDFDTPSTSTPMAQREGETRWWRCANGHRFEQGERPSALLDETIKRNEAARLQHESKLRGGTRAVFKKGLLPTAGSRVRVKRSGTIRPEYQGRIVFVESHLSDERVVGVFENGEKVALHADSVELP